MDSIIAGSLQGYGTFVLFFAGLALIMILWEIRK